MHIVMDEADKLLQNSLSKEKKNFYDDIN